MGWPTSRAGEQYKVKFILSCFIDFNNVIITEALFNKATLTNNANGFRHGKHQN